MRVRDRKFAALAVIGLICAAAGLFMSPTVRAGLTETGVFAAIFGTPPEAALPAMENIQSASDAFHFLDPIAPSSGDTTKLDASLLNYLTVEVCEITATECNTVKTFTSQSATSEQLRIVKVASVGGYYVVNWDTQKAKISLSKTYRIVVSIPGLQLGSIDLTPDVYRSFGRTWPIKFLVENDPVIRVRIMRYLGKSCSQIANALRSEFGLTADETGQLLAGDLTPCSQQEIDVALQGVFQDVVIPDTTKITDQLTRDALASYDPETGILIYLTETDLLKGLREGDVIASEPGNAAPYGYLRKVMSIRKEKGRVVLTTVQARLTEAISQGQLVASGVLTSSSASPSSLSASKTAGATERFITPSLDEGDETVVDVPIDVTINLEGGDDEVGGTGVVRIQGHVHFKAGYNIGAGIELCAEVPPVCVDRLETWMGFEQKSNLRITGNFDGKVHKEQIIYPVPMSPIVIFIGPLPVILVPRIDVVLGVHGEAHISFSVAAEVESNVKAGLKWTDPDDGGEGWKDISNIDPLSRTFFDADLSGNISMEAFGKLDASLLLYGAIGPAMNGSLGIGATAQYPGKPVWTVFGHAKSGIGISSIFSDLFGISPPDDNLLDETFLIKEADNQPPECNYVTNIIQAEINVAKTLGPRSGFDGYFDCSDPEGEDISYSAVSSFSTDGNNGVLPNTGNIIRYAFPTVGLRTVTVTARDTSGISKSFNLGVEVRNSLPIVTISAATANVRATVQFFAAATAYDPETGFLGCDRLDWSVDSADTVTEYSSGGTCRAVVKFAQPGNRTLTVTATDPNGGTFWDSLPILVTDPPATPAPEIDPTSFSIRSFKGPASADCELFSIFDCETPNGALLFNGQSGEFYPPLTLLLTVTGGTPEWHCTTGGQEAPITDLGEGAYSCDPVYSPTAPIKVYAVIPYGGGLNSDGADYLYSEVRTYYMLQRTN